MLKLLAVFAFVVVASCKEDVVAVERRQLFVGPEESLDIKFATDRNLWITSNISDDLPDEYLSSICPIPADGTHNSELCVELTQTDSDGHMLRRFGYLSHGGLLFLPEDGQILIRLDNYAPMGLNIVVEIQERDSL